jgi:Dr1-associated corepressor
MDDDYRPRSPDLSSATHDDAPPIHPQHQQYRGSVSHPSPYTPITPVGAQPDNYFSRHAQWPQPTYNNNVNANSYNPFAPQSPSQQFQQPQFQSPQFQLQQQPQHPSAMPRVAAVKSELKPDPMDEDFPAPRRGRGRGAGVKKALKEESHDEDMLGGENSYNGPEIKTKFPVARIKRIMQADEDVGKVAQVTPIAVCMYYSSLFFLKQG